MGLLVMAYGTPYEEADIERYYTHIRHGRKPSEESLEDLRNRYKAIGGLSPLAKITQDQADDLGARLNEVQDEIDFKVYLGLKHIEPCMQEEVVAMARNDIKEEVLIVLAPHFSTFSVKSYNGRAADAAEKAGIELVSVESWYTEPKFIQYWSEKVSATFAGMSEEERAKSCLIVSAHSLPEKIIANGDPYPDQLKETAALISEAAGVENVEVGWQSAGQTPEPWIGPDVQDLTRELYEQKGYTSFVYTPVGFVADHLEVLFDNDYECKVVCDEIGATYHRPEMPNVQPLFIDGLTDVVLKKLAE